jgi:hypothetical protein
VILAKLVILDMGEEETKVSSYGEERELCFSFFFS